MSASSPRTCSASINLDGRVGCDCMRGQPDLRADLALCFARIEVLVAQANEACAGSGEHWTRDELADFDPSEAELTELNGPQ